MCMCTMRNMCKFIIKCNTECLRVLLNYTLLYSDLSPVLSKDQHKFHHKLIQKRLTLLHKISPKGHRVKRLRIKSSRPRPLLNMLDGNLNPSLWVPKLCVRHVKLNCWINILSRVKFKTPWMKMFVITYSINFILYCSAIILLLLIVCWLVIILAHHYHFPSLSILLGAQLHL